MDVHIVCSIDVGTTKICTLIGQLHEDGSIATIGYSVVPSKGLRKGVIVDIDAAASAIAESLNKAERMAGVQVNRAVAGVTGHHIRSSNCRSTISIHGEDDIITEEHVRRLLSEAQMLVNVPEDYEVLHVIQRQFILDGVGGVHNPVGMHGRKLSADVHFVFARSSFMRNLMECLYRAGIEHIELVLEPIAAAESVLSETEKQLGVALLDIGGGTTDIAIFIEGSIVYSRALPIGGNHVTQDLSIGLRTSFQEAEALKLQHGCAIEGKVQKDEVIEVRDIGSNSTRVLPKKVLAQIIELRMRELFEFAHAGISESGLIDHLAGGLVLTGGGSLLRYADELAREVIDLPTRIGIPRAQIELSESLRSPIYATSMGLLLYAAKLVREKEKALLKLSIWQRIANAIRSLFGGVKL